MSGIVKAFINQLNIIVSKESPTRELIVCTILRQSPIDVNRILCDNGLDSWIIKSNEESTLAKIAILYQLANGCVKYTKEFRRMCRLLQAHVENSNLETPNLTKTIGVALGQFKDYVFM